VIRSKRVPDRLAIVIGVDHYGSGIPELTCGESDARAVAAALGAHGFHEADGSLITLYDRTATLDAIRNALTVRLPAAGALDHVVVYFAGHGQAVPDEKLVLRGYLLPVDAGPVRANYLDMDEVREAFSRLTCRHLFVVLDCCAAGAFARARMRDVALDQVPMFRARFESLRRRRSYQLLASAAHDQQAVDRFEAKLEQDKLGTASPFAAAFLEALTQQAIVDNDRCGVVDATRVFQHVRATVNASFPRQLPNLWPLDWHDNGEFLFQFGEPQFLSPTTLRREDSPFPGAAPLVDRSLVFGRDSAIETVAKLVATHGGAVITGASGIGKTSVLAAVTARVLASADGELLVVDGLDALTVESRAARLAEVAARPAGTRVLIAIRDELMAECTSILPAQARFTLLRMDRDAMRDAIELPATRRYLVFSSVFSAASRRLVDTLLDEIDGAPGALALLAIALGELFDAYVASGRDDRTIGWSDYVPIATLAARRAEAVFKFPDLDETACLEHQTSLRDLMLRLTRSGAGVLERRRLPRQRLQFVDPAETARTARVLDALIDARVIVAERGNIELAADGLATAWPRIAAWHAERPTELLDRLGTAAVEWAPARPKALMWADDRLAALRPLIPGATRLSTRAVLAGVAASTFTTIERDFIARSDKRRRSLIELAWLVTAAIVVVLAIAAVYSAVQRRAADDARGVAEDREREATHLLALSYVEEARHLIVDKGRPLAALPYLVAARQRGVSTPAVATMFGIAEAALPDTAPHVPESEHPIAMWLDDDRVLLGGTTDIRAYSRAATRFVGSSVVPPHGIEKIAVCRADRRIVIGGSGELGVWDATTGRQIGPPITVDGPLRDVGFSRDGSRIWAAASRAEVWRVADHAHLGSLSYRNADLQFDATATRLLVSAEPAEVRDIATGMVVGRPIATGVNQAAALFPDGRTLVTALDGTAELWDVDTGARRGRPRSHEVVETSDRNVDIAIDANGTRAVTADESTRTAQVWSVVGDRVTEPFGSDIFGAELDYDGQLVLAAGQTGYQIWDASSGVALTPVLEQGFDIGAAYELSPSAVALAETSHNGAVRIWNLDHLLPKHGTTGSSSTDAHTDRGNIIASCSNSTSLVTEIATDSDSRTYAIWDVQLVRAPLDAHGTLAACDEAGRVLVVGKEAAELWDVAAGIHLELPVSANIITAAFAPRANRIYATRDRTLLAWTGNKLDVNFLPATVGRAAEIAVRPDGAIVAWSNDDRTRLLVVSSTGARLPPLDLMLAPASSNVEDRRIGSFSRNGTALVLVAEKPDSVVVYSTQTGLVIGSITQLPNSILGATPNRDGSLVALVFGNGVQIWDVATGQSITPMFWHTYEPRDVEFGANDNTLVTSDAAGNLFVWPLPRDDRDVEEWARTAARSPYSLVAGVLQRGSSSQRAVTTVR
jgi:WD40 repeat protein